MNHVGLIILGIVLFSQATVKPDFSLVGFAAGVTGGTGGKTVQVNNASSFKSNCQSSEKVIIQVTGKIDNASTDVASNKTIIGMGASGELTGTTLSISDGSNIIIRNLDSLRRLSTNDSQASIDGLRLVGGQVTTTGLMLSPNWVFANNQRTQQGYVGRHTITVTFDITAPTVTGAPAARPKR